MWWTCCWGLLSVLLRGYAVEGEVSSTEGGCCDLQGGDGEGNRRERAIFQALICGKFASLSFDWYGIWTDEYIGQCGIHLTYIHMTRLTHNTLKLDLFLVASRSMYPCFGGVPTFCTAGTATACYMSKALQAEKGLRISALGTSTVDQCLKVTEAERSISPKCSTSLKT